jgi:ACR3 family arsenite transporter
VGLFVVVPFVMGVLTQIIVLGRENGELLLDRIERFFQPLLAIALVLFVVFIFISQANVIVESPVDVLLCIAPLLLQTSLVFLSTYSLAFLLFVSSITLWAPLPPSVLFQLI